MYSNGQERNWSLCFLYKYFHKDKSGCWKLKRKLSRNIYSLWSLTCQPPVHKCALQHMFSPSRIRPCFFNGVSSILLDIFKITAVRDFKLRKSIHMKNRQISHIAISAQNYTHDSYCGFKCQRIRGRNPFLSNLPQFGQTTISQQRLLYVKQTQELQ